MYVAKALGAGPPADRNLLDVEYAFREYRDQCYRTALRVVRDPHLAHDVVQNVFEAVAGDPGRFHADRGSLAGWLTTLTRNRAIDLIRSRQSRTKLDDKDDVLGGLPDRHRGPEDLAVTSVEYARAITALHDLRPAEREVLVLAYLDGYSQTEIASVTGLPLGTVKARTRRALQRVRHTLDGA